MRIGLKIDVDTYRGTREGVPRLLALLDRRQIRATFLFSLGPDHTGRALRRALRPGFLKKVRRTSVISHYGLKTLLYGTLLPGPDIGRRCVAEMRAARTAGHEVGIHCYDHVRWQDNVAGASDAWTAAQMRLAAERFIDIFGVPAHVHGAAGWQMNATAFALTERMKFRYSSDTRGSGPFLPRNGDRIIRCPQIPTTLPTLDELVGLRGLTGGDPVTHLLGLTARRRSDQVYTLHAELEGMALRPSFERLLDGWRVQGRSPTALQECFDALNPGTLPVCRVRRACVPGRSGELTLQGEPS